MAARSAPDRRTFRAELTDTGAYRHRAWVRGKIGSNVLGLLGGSVTLRHASGQPTYAREASRALDRGIIDPDRVNARRLPGDLRIDMCLDRRDHFSWGTVPGYVEMRNGTGRRNVAARRYDADTSTVEDVTHRGRFVVGGVKVGL
ncbi:MAG: hypothetical protein ABEL97_10455 [Salinibacter sp.]